MRLIGEVNVIVYDRLVSETILDLIPAGTMQIFAGKRAQNHFMPQDEINALLVDLYYSGRRVMRLKGGAPFVFGRGGEEVVHLAERGIRFEIVPGITGMSGCWTATGHPITWGDDVLTVLMATLDEEELATRAANTDALVVMKIGRNLDKLKRALTKAGRLQDAWLVEKGTMAGQTVQKLTEVPADVPYFSIAIVHGQGRRP